MPDRSDTRYYSERVHGEQSRDRDEVTDEAWGGIVSLFRTAVTDGSFGHAFPEECYDGRGVVGTDGHDMRLRLRAEHPQIDWPLDPDARPETDLVFDLIEYGWDHIAAPIQQDHHPYFGHHHLTFDVAAGQRKWQEDVNRILRRSRIAFDLEPDGRVARLVPTPFTDVLLVAEFDTGDATLDNLVAQAVGLFTDRHVDARRDAVEKLWDAFERAKTLLEGDKRQSATRLLEASASTDEFFELLNQESLLLTKIGNRFRIRHSETHVVEVTAEELDYLFARLFSLLWHLLTPARELTDG